MHKKFFFVLLIKYIFRKWIMFMFKLIRMSALWMHNTLNDVLLKLNLFTNWPQNWQNEPNLLGVFILETLDEGVNQFNNWGTYLWTEETYFYHLWKARLYNEYKNKIKLSIGCLYLLQISINSRDAIIN
jgi:hypothetical protein